MGEIVEECGDVEMSNNEITFDNFVILKEFGNLINLVSNEEFLAIVPKAKLRVKWIPMFNCLKQSIYEEMIEELSCMWKNEYMTEKLDILEKQKEKFNEINTINKPLWRPQLGNVKAQLRGIDASNLKKQKVLLESLAKEYEARVDRLKKTITAKRGYIKAMQLDIQKHQKKNEEFIFKMNNMFENHNKNLNNLKPSIQTNVEEMNWIEGKEI